MLASIEPYYPGGEDPGNEATRGVTGGLGVSWSEEGLTGGESALETPKAR
jgi:hypothetical protein